MGSKIGFLGDILPEEAIKDIKTYIVKKITEENPGSDTDYNIRPGLENLTIGYYPPPEDNSKVYDKVDNENDKSKVIEDPMINIAILMDGSGSVTEEFYTELVDNLVDRFEYLKVGAEGKICVIRFGRCTECDGWLDFNNEYYIEDEFDPYLDGQSKITISYLKDILDRNNGPTGVIMLTDGVLNNHDEVFDFFNTWVTDSYRKLGIIHYNSPKSSIESIPHQIKQYENIADVFYVKSLDNKKFARDISIHFSAYLKYLTRRELYPE
ncbi:vWA domain-containing protein [Nanoarchaeota archaeon]